MHRDIVGLCTSTLGATMREVKLEKERWCVSPELEDLMVWPWDEMTTAEGSSC